MKEIFEDNYKEKVTYNDVKTLNLKTSSLNIILAETRMKIIYISSHKWYGR